MIGRKEWDDLSGKATNFSIDEQIAKTDESVMRRARALYDELVKPTAQVLVVVECMQ